MDDLTSNANRTRVIIKEGVLVTPVWIIQMTLYCFIILTGTIGNGIICWNVFKNKQRRISEYLIANLAVTDLATCLISVPFDFVERITGDFPFGSIMCFIIYPFQTILMAVSVITLLCMSFERYRIVMAPLRPRMTSGMAKICIAIAWAVPVIVITPYALVLRLEGKHCLEDWPEDWYVKVFTLCVFVLFFVIPLFAIGWSYIRACRKLQSELVRFKTMGDTHSRTHALYARKRALQKLQVTKMFILAFVVFTICMFPNHVIWLWYDFGSGRSNKHFRNRTITRSRDLVMVRFRKRTIQQTLQGNFNFQQHPYLREQRYRSIYIPTNQHSHWFNGSNAENLWRKSRLQLLLSASLRYEDQLTGYRETECDS